MPVNHPSHYVRDGLEVIDIIEGWGLSQNFHLANSVKYILRHNAKGRPLEDLRKALWYVERCGTSGLDTHPSASKGTIAIERVVYAFQLPDRLAQALIAIRRAGANRYLRPGLLAEASLHLREYLADMKIGADLVA